MMQPWDLLGLEPTRDTGAIRRAYAAAAARYNPEEHPEEFLAVRRAYEQAMAYARGQEQPDAPPETPAPQPQPAESAGPAKQEAETGGFTLWEETQGEGGFPCPALERFEELYRSKQRRDRKQWDLWFTSPEFLAVFHDPRFTHALWQAVDQAGEEFPPPKEFQLALAVAYRYRAEVYRAHTEFVLEQGAGFEGVNHILRIAGLGPLVRKLQGNDVVLSVAYQDYDTLCGLARAGRWEQPDLERLQKVLIRYSSAYLKEKCSGRPETERNIVSMRLLEAFFNDHSLPVDAYEVLWNIFDLNSAIMGRSKVFYGRLREIVLAKAPEVCAPRERFVELRTAYIDLGSEVQAAGGEDSPRGRALVERFMAREDFQRAIRNRVFVRDELLPHWCSWFSNPHLLQALSALYEADQTLPYAHSVVEAIRQALLQREGEMAAKREREQLAQLAMEDIGPESCTLSNPLFLRYFLQTAFYWAEGQEQESLYALLDREFSSNQVWNQQLAQAELSRSIPLTQSGTDETGQSVQRTMEIQLLFHQFYVEYRMDGQVLCNLELPFWGLAQLEDDELFLLLLPILSAFQDEREEVQAHLRERLARLGLPDTLLSRTAEALAGEAACLVPTEGGAAILRPARFCQEAEGELYSCAWYGNGQLLAFRRTADGLGLLREFCRDGVSSLQDAWRISTEIFKEVFAPAPSPDELNTGLCQHLHVEYSAMPSQDFEGEAITPALLAQLLQGFEVKQVTRLVVNHNLVLLWSQPSFVTDAQPGTCALLRFRDDAHARDGLLSDWESYYYGQADQTPQLPFRMGTLPDYLVHRTPQKPIETLVALLNGIDSGNGRWSNKVDLYNTEYHYYYYKRTQGCFSMEECGGALLRRRYVLNKTPLRFAYQESGGTVTRLEVNAATRLTLTDQLVRFEMGGLDYLSLSWELEELGPVHLVLLHQRADKERRDLAVLIQDSPQSIDYLVADRWEYINTDRKVRKAEFRGRMIPRYLIHYDFAGLRDFLDLFFLSLPRPKSLLHYEFGSLASGPDHLTKLGFAEHRRRLLELEPGTN